MGDWEQAHPILLCLLWGCLEEVTSKHGQCQHCSLLLFPRCPKAHPSRISWQVRKSGTIWGEHGRSSFFYSVRFSKGPCLSLSGPRTVEETVPVRGLIISLHWLIHSECAYWMWWVLWQTQAAPKESESSTKKMVSEAGLQERSCHSNRDSRYRSAAKWWLLSQGRKWFGFQYLQPSLYWNKHNT